MKRSHILVLLGVLTGCAGLIGVPDLELEVGAADGGSKTDGAITPTAEGSTTIPDASGTPTDAGDGGPVVCSGNTPIQTDVDNCGRCGHSCGGGACAGGICQPVQLASGLSTPYTMDGDATYLYFPTYLAPSTIQRVRKDGKGAAEIMINSGISYATGVHVEGTTLYFTTTEGVQRCTLTGSDAGATACTIPQIIAPNLDGEDGVGPEDITALAGELYWSDDNGDVYRMLPDGGARRNIFTDLNHPFKIAFGGPNIYVSTTQETILEAALVDGGAESTAGPLESLYSTAYVVADDGGYYYAYVDYSTSDGVVLGGNNASRVTSSITSSLAAGHPAGVAIDATNIYWIDAGSLNAAIHTAVGDGKLLTCPRTGCVGPPTVIASGLFGGGPIVIDGDFIYYVENNYENDFNTQTGARVSKVAKP